MTQDPDLQRKQRIALWLEASQARYAVLDTDGLAALLLAFEIYLEACATRRVRA